MPRAITARPRIFFTRNVRLITFLACVAVFLALFAMLEGVDLFPFDNTEDTCPEMTLEELRALASAPERITPEVLDTYRGERDENTVDSLHYSIYQIKIGKRWFLMASFDRSNRHLFYLTLTDLQTHTDLDLLKNASRLDAFLGEEAN